MRSIINVANRLPVTVGETIRRSSGGLVSALDGVSSTEFSLKWVGWPGATFEDEAVRADIEQRLRSEFGFHPVFLSEEEIAKYYDGFSNSSLWPLLHYIPNYMRYDDEEWDAYRVVNQRFADAVLELAEDDSLVWVHDYHMMLVPSLLRKARPSLRVGFFFHTPFPSSEVFRCHPRRDELLRGVLGADQIGFHTFGYLRHFRSSALRVLGLESEMGSIADGNHLTSLGVYPIGINTRRFQDELKSEFFYAKREDYARTWRGRRVVLSVERLDYTKGLLHRLEAIDLFLSQCSNTDEIVFVFISVPSRDQVAEYQTLRESIEGEIGRINGKYATVENSPIQFIHSSVEFTELCALYSLADVALVTPLVDGMNLVAKEYVVCQKDDPGVLILSEFAGAAQELVNAVTVNPYNPREVADSIQLALGLAPEERHKRMKYMRTRVTQYDASFWARSFLNDLSEQVQFIRSAVEVGEAERSIASRFSKGKRVALFLDYDGTLREFEKVPDKAFPNDVVKEVLNRLRDSEAEVFIISGRKGSTLVSWLGDYGFNLIAEHGHSYWTAQSGEWKPMNANVDLSWKAQMMDVLRHYEAYTPGSFVEEKQSALVWHYRQSDPEFGSWKANQLVSEIYEMLANFPVEIHHGKKIVEVSSIYVNKGTAVEHFLARSAYDIVVCAGDDQTDEAMFRIDHPELLTIKVGPGDTRAEFRLEGPAAFRALLIQMVDAMAHV